MAVIHIMGQQVRGRRELERKRKEAQSTRKIRLRLWPASKRKRQKKKKFPLCELGLRWVTSLNFMRKAGAWPGAGIWGRIYIISLKK